MSVTFTKLFASITESTVWCEPDATRLAWITMLAMADSRGRVWASIPGLANRARISVDSTRDAIATFLSPDPDSRTPDHEGRRIEPMDGGWRLLNHEKYRSIRDEESIKESKRRYINQRRAKERGVEKVELCRYNAEADTEAVKSKALSGSPDIELGNGKQKCKADAEGILAFLNEKTGKNFRPGKVNLDFIAERLKEGATVVECRQVIAKKAREWMGTDMESYLRPATLFNRTKFAQYQGELV